ncbi:MAG: hypothetical protein PHU85_12465, partial [Phycisphaerae bacterium]|nr:hypothetical protein [Phycisphaerae bacterium]
DRTGLAKLFVASVAPAGDDKAARDTLVAWLRLSQELVQDGMFRFTIPADQIKVARTNSGMTATGQAVVDGGGRPGPMMGNQGGITATLTFDPKGKLAKVDEKHNVQAGIRPVCQATKLLDADPIVRKMAEQDLLIMGSAAADYLAEQRAKASPQLQRAIDEMWRRIREREAGR